MRSHRLQSSLISILIRLSLVSLSVIPLPVSAQSIAMTETNASNALNAGNYSEAITIYTKLIVATPKKFKLYQGRGIAYYNTQKFDRSIADFSQFIALRPNLPEGYINRANAYKATKRYQEALKDLDKVEALAPTQADHLLRGDIYRSLGDLPNAVKEYNLVIKSGVPVDGSPRLIGIKADSNTNKAPVSPPTDTQIKEDAAIAAGIGFEEAKIITKEQPTITDEQLATKPKPVRVEFTIAPNGSCTYKIIAGSDNPEVDAAVLKACTTYRWKPALRSGKPVQSTVFVTFTTSASDY